MMVRPSSFVCAFVVQAAMAWGYSQAQECKSESPRPPVSLLQKSIVAKVVTDSHAFGAERKAAHSATSTDKDQALAASLIDISSQQDHIDSSVIGLPSAATMFTQFGSSVQTEYFSKTGLDKLIQIPSEGITNSMLDGSTHADWVLLAASVVVLVLFDALFLSRLTTESRLPEETNTALRDIFAACDPKCSGWATPETLREALATREEAVVPSAWLGNEKPGEVDAVVDAKLATLAAMEQQVKFEEFENVYTQALLLSGGVCPHDRGSMKTHVICLAIWVGIAGIYNGIVFAQKGGEAAILWSTGYLLEWLLSMDNLFVFHLVFKTYSTPRPLLQNALFIGIVGAIIARMGFFAVVAYLLALFRGVRVIFGLLLCYSGIQAAQEEDEEEDPADHFVMKCFQKVCGSRIRTDYDLQGRFWVKNAEGQWEGTLLVPVVLCLVATDVLFALDSVSAKTAQIPNFYISYSSSVLALFGMRSMFFIIQNLVEWFEYLKYGLCFILIFIGMELMFEPFVTIPAYGVLLMISIVFTVCITGSILVKEDKGKSEPKCMNADKLVKHVGES